MFVCKRIWQSKRGWRIKWYYIYALLNTVRILTCASASFDALKTSTKGKQWLKTVSISRTMFCWFLEGLGLCTVENIIQTVLNHSYLSLSAWPALKWRAVTLIPSLLCWKWIKTISPSLLLTSFSFLSPSAFVHRSFRPGLVRDCTQTVPKTLL